MAEKRVLIYNASMSGKVLSKDSIFLLEKMILYVEKIILVSKEEVKVESNLLKDRVTKVETENAGDHNLNAYECAIRKLNELNCSDYEEIVCVSDNLMGPVGSLENIFGMINMQEADVWGMNKQHPTPLNYLDYSGANLQREYLPSYFLVFSKKLVQNGTLLHILEESRKKQNAPDSWIDQRELFLTEELQKQGYAYKVCIDVEDLEHVYYNPLLLNPVEMLSRRGCPFFLKENFIGNYDTIITNTSGQAGLELMEYLKKHSDYDIDMIWDSILKCGHQQDINHNLQLNYILDKKTSPKEKIQNILDNKKIVLVMHLYFMDLLEESLHYAQSMPESADVYITTNTSEKKEQIEKVFSRLQCHKVEVRVIENRGRDVSSLLVGVKDVIFDYDYVCFVHDKKSAQVVPASIGKDFGYQCFENTLGSKEFVENVICTLYENERLGMLSPIYPIHGSYFATHGNFDWGANYENTKEMHEKLKLEIPISREKSPVAPLGTMFWFKAPALKKLYECDWEYEDFPPEPNGVDGTLLHAIERIYSYVVQEEGYYPAMLINKEFADIQITNLTTFLQGINHTLVKYYPHCSYQQAIHYINYMGYTIKEQQAVMEERERHINELIPQASLKFQIKRKIKQVLHIKR